MKMNFITFALIGITSAHAYSMVPDFSVKCQASNSWTIGIDYYWDGHPQGSGGWSGIGQINDWGKFPVDVIDESTWKSLAVSHGQSRLDHIEIDLTVTKNELRVRERTSIGSYTPWKKYALTCLNLRDLGAH